MSKFIYKNPLRISRKKALKIFADGSKDEIIDALLAITLYDDDCKWSQDQCLHFLNHLDHDLRGLAVTCLGHIARIHCQLDRELVINALKSLLNDDKIAGQVQAALDDIIGFFH